MAFLQSFNRRQYPSDRLTTRLDSVPVSKHKLTKMLLNVNIQGSVGPVQVVMSCENAVGDLVKATVEIYVKEKRRPLLQETDIRRFELHYSQFCFESLNKEEKLINLCSRNFYLCKRPTELVDTSSCFDEVNKLGKSTFPLIKLMDFLL